MALKLPAFVDARQLEIKMLPEDLLQLLIENPKSALRPTEEEWKAHFEWMTSVAGYSYDAVLSRSKKPIEERKLGIRVSFFTHFYRAGFPIDLIEASKFDTEEGWAKKGRKVCSFVTKIDGPVVNGNAGWWCTSDSVSPKLISESPDVSIVHFHHTFPADDPDEKKELERISFQFFPFQPKPQAPVATPVVVAEPAAPEKVEKIPHVHEQKVPSPLSAVDAHSDTHTKVDKNKWNTKKKVPKVEGPAYLVEEVAQTKALDEEIKKLINIRDDLRPTKEEWEAYAQWLTLMTFPKSEINDLMAKPIWKRNPGVRIAMFLHFYRLDIPIDQIIPKNIATVNSWREEGRIAWESAKYVWAPIIKSDPTWWCKKQIIDPNVIDQVPLGRVCHIFQTSPSDVSDWTVDRDRSLAIWKEQKALNTSVSPSTVTSFLPEESSPVHTPPRMDKSSPSSSSSSSSSPVHAYQTASQTTSSSSSSSPIASATSSRTTSPTTSTGSEAVLKTITPPVVAKQTTDPKIIELKKQLENGEIDEDRFYELVGKIHRKRKRQMEAEKRRRYEEQTQHAIVIQANIVKEMTETMERYVIARLMSITKVMRIEDSDFVARMLEVNSELANNVESCHTVPSFPSLSSDADPSSDKASRSKSPSTPKSKGLY